jgi:hypothetical protein
MEQTIISPNTVETYTAERSFRIPSSEIFTEYPRLHAVSQVYPLF